MQACLKNNRSNATSAKSASLLAGKLFDDKGNYMTPKHAGTHKKHYRYYTSQAIIKGRNKDVGSLANIPAHEIEQVVKSEIYAFMADGQKLQPYLAQESIERQNEILLNAASIKFERSCHERLFLQAVLEKIIVSKHSIEIFLRANNLLYWFKNEEVVNTPDAENIIVITKEIELTQARDGSKVIAGTISSGCNMHLVKLVAQSFLWHEQLLSSELLFAKDIAEKYNINSQNYINKILRLRFLAPEIITAIISGNHPKEWTFKKLSSFGDMDWNKQISLLG